MINTQYSISDLITLLLGGCGGIAIIGKAVEWLAKLVHTIRKPEEKQNSEIDSLKRRLTDIESKIRKHELAFEGTNDKLEEIIDGMRVLQRVSLVTLSHAINGNDVEKLKEEEQELQRYLTKRR